MLIFIAAELQCCNENARTREVHLLGDVGIAGLHNLTQSMRAIRQLEAMARSWSIATCRLAVKIRMRSAIRCCHKHSECNLVWRSLHPLQAKNLGMLKCKQTQTQHWN